MEEGQVGSEEVVGVGEIGPDIPKPNTACVALYLLDLGRGVGFPTLGYASPPSRGVLSAGGTRILMPCQTLDAPTQGEPG